MRAPGKANKIIVIAGFMTGGALAVRGGLKAARNSAITCGCLLAVIEGVGIAFQRMTADQTKLEVCWPYPSRVKLLMNDSYHRHRHLRRHRWNLQDHPCSLDHFPDSRLFEIGYPSFRGNYGKHFSPPKRTFTMSFFHFRSRSATTMSGSTVS